MTWNIDPIIFEYGPIAVRWYGLFFATAFVVGYVIISKIYEHEGHSRRSLDTMLMYVIAGTVIGARLGHCLFYDPVYYINNPIEIVKVWKGGLASHGGALGIASALFLFSRNHAEQQYLKLLDRISVPAALGGSIVRIGNFFNSEIIGEPSSLPWAIVFERIDPTPRHPAQLYEALAYFLIFLILLVVYRRRAPNIPSGRLTGLFLTMVFGLRIVIEYVKVKQAAFMLPIDLSMGQLLSLPVIVLGLVLVYRSADRH